VLKSISANVNVTPVIPGSQVKLAERWHCIEKLTMIYLL